MDDPERKSLLEKHAPLLLFDSLECLRPVPIKAYVAGSTIVDREGCEVPAESPESLPRPGSREDRLNPLPGDTDLNTDRRSNLLLETYGAVTDPSEAGSCYGRLIEWKDWILLQYWFFYVDNPYVLPQGRHDGDWEMVQVGLHRKGQDYDAMRLTFAQHGHGDTRELKPGTGHPPVFVAAGSHAAYPEAGTHPHFPVPDECDGTQAPAAPPNVILMEEDSDQDWRYWKGRWGMDRGLGSFLVLHWHIPLPQPLVRRFNHLGAGDSPVSPGCQGTSWAQPRTFQGFGKLRGATTVKARGFAYLLGKLTWPRATPKVTVYRISENTYSITAKPAGHFFRRIKRVMVIFEETGTGKALALHTIRTGRTIGHLKGAGPDQITWRGAGYNFLRQRGNVIGPKEARAATWPIKLTGASRADQGGRQVFEGELTSHLRSHGASKKSTLVGNLGWFWLRFNNKEVVRVIDAARRDGLVCPLGQTRDAAGAAIGQTEWSQTDQGRALERVRALSFRDSLVAARGVGPPTISTVQKLGTRAGALLASLLPFLVLPKGLVSTIVALVAAGVILTTVLTVGIRGEVALGRAALRWPRLQTCRPHIYAWQTTQWRPWERVPVAASALVYVIVAAFALRTAGGWSYDIPAAIAILGAALLLSALFLFPAWRRWNRLAKAYRKERDQVRRLRRDESNHACAWGHICRAALDGSGARCEKFGPAASAERTSPAATTQAVPE